MANTRWRFGLIGYHNRTDVALLEVDAGKAIVLTTFTPGTKHERGARKAVEREKDLVKALRKVLIYNHDSDKAERRNACLLAGIDPETLEEVDDG